MNKKYYGHKIITDYMYRLWTQDYYGLLCQLHAVVAAVAACFPTLQHADLTTRITELEPKTRSELPLPY